MKKLLIASAIVATFFAPQAFAQAKNFEGASLTANLNFANTTSDVTSTVFNGSSTESAQNLGLQGQYNFPIGQSFVLGVGMTLGLGDLKAGTFNVSGTTITIKQKESYSFYIAPGMAISDTTLLYGKIAAISAKFEATGNSTTANTASGTGFGVGVQSFLNKNLFIQGELMQNQYADRSFTALTETDKNKATVISVGVGYKF
jgi:outer membrane immunogenic protein